MQTILPLIYGMLARSLPGESSLLNVVGTAFSRVSHFPFFRLLRYCLRQQGLHM